MLGKPFASWASLGHSPLRVPSTAAQKRDRSGHIHSPENAKFLKTEFYR
jgi:hypothetical protein